MANFFQNALLLVALILSGASGHLCFKKGASMLDLKTAQFSLSGVGSVLMQIIRNGWLLSGVALMGLGFVVYVLVLTRLRLNLAYPIYITGGIALVTLGSFFWLKESFNLAQVLGILLIVLGIFLLFAFSRA